MKILEEFTIFLTVLAVIVFGFFFGWLLHQIGLLGHEVQAANVDHIHLAVNSQKPVVERVHNEVLTRSNTIDATVTAFNTVKEQTDGNPCNAAGGNICGRTDTLACPKKYKLHTWFEILGKKYECMDRTHSRYDGRFDISFDKDIKAARNFGKRHLKVTILK